MAGSKLHPLIADYGKAHKKEYDAIFRAIKRYDKIVVFRHLKPDFDALGSQLGLVQFLKDNFPEKEIHYVGDNHVTFTPRVYPPMEELPNDWFTSNKFLAIILDVGDASRVADPRFKHAKYKVKIDHHPCKEEIARASLLDTSMAAAAELLTNLLLHFKGTTITKEAAYYLYTAIVGDSGRFLFSSTSPHTFAIAQALLATGLSLAPLYQKMYEKSIDSLRSLAYILNNFEVSPHGVAYYLLPDAVQKELKITPEQGKEHVNTFSNISGINAWCSITEDPNPKDYCWRISIRSKGKDISGVAQKYEGGGHAQASGAKIPDLSKLPDFIADMDALFAE